METTVGAQGRTKTGMQENASDTNKKWLQVGYSCHTVPKHLLLSGAREPGTPCRPSLQAFESIGGRKTETSASLSHSRDKENAPLEVFSNVNFHTNPVRKTLISLEMSIRMELSAAAPVR